MKRAKVRKDRDRLRNCHRLKEIENTGTECLVGSCPGSCARERTPVGVAGKTWIRFTEQTIILYQRVLILITGEVKVSEAWVQEL